MKEFSEFVLPWPAFLGVVAALAALFYHLPVRTALFASLALTSCAVAAAKLWALSRCAAADRMAAPA